MYDFNFFLLLIFVFTFFNTSENFEKCLQKCINLYVKLCIFYFFSEQIKITTSITKIIQKRENKSMSLNKQNIFPFVLNTVLFEADTIF